jgi:hypothetical protein
MLLKAGCLIKFQSIGALYSFLFDFEINTQRLRDGIKLIASESEGFTCLLEHKRPAELSDLNGVVPFGLNNPLNI